MTMTAMRDDGAGSPMMVRRALLVGMGLAATPFWEAMAAQTAGGAASAPLTLPLKLASITHHIGISVRDVTASATFYSKLFGGDNVDGEKTPALRYFINLNSGSGVSGSTSPGSVAIGALGTAGGAGRTVPLIDHICLDARPFEAAAWEARAKQEGYRTGGAGIFIGFDNLPIQLSGGEGVQLSAGAIEKVPTLYKGRALVRSHGYDHVLVRVSDVEKAAVFFNKFFGLRTVGRSDDVLWLGDGATRLGLRRVAAGEEPGFDRYAVKVDAFDRAKLSRELTAIGATVAKPVASDGRKILRFADPDGLNVALTFA